jgi:hypothetical protein
MDDKIVQEFKEVRQDIANSNERIKALETQGTTEDAVQEDYSQEKQWNTSNIIAFSGWIFLVAYILFNYFHL